MSILETNKLTKCTKKYAFYSDISIHIREGDCYALIGADDEGKTSFLNTFLGFTKATSGTYTLLGEQRFSRKLWKSIGYVPDELLCFPNITGASLLDLTIALKKLKNAYEYAAELIDYFAIDPSIPLYQLDDSDNKCIYLINALLSQPKFLILDEPFNFLSEKASDKLRELLKQYIQKKNTILITSDNYNDVHNLCNRLSILKNGVQILRDESPGNYKPQKLITARYTNSQPQKHTVETEYLPAKLKESVRILQTDSSETQYLYTGPAAQLHNILKSLHLTDYTIADISIHDQLLRTYEWMEEAQ